MTNESHCCSRQGEMKGIKVKFTSESALGEAVVFKWELISRCQSKMKVPVARAHCWGMKTPVMELVMVSS